MSGCVCPRSVDLKTVNCIIYYLVSDNFLQMRLAPKLYCARWLVIQSNVLIAVSAIYQSSVVIELHMMYLLMFISKY